MRSIMTKQPSVETMILASDLRAGFEYGMWETRSDTCAYVEVRAVVD